MERLTGPTMAQALDTGDLGLAEAAQILADLLARLHSLPIWPGAAPGTSILHLDLHPENVMLPGPGENRGPARRPDLKTDHGSARRPDLKTDHGTALGTGPGPDHGTAPRPSPGPERGPMVIDWRNATSGEADLDTAFTALILAQVAIGSIAHPLGARAGDLLDLFLPQAPGDPTRLLDDVVAMRARQSTMSPDEVGALPTAAARVRAGR
jgi:hypothetical protein